MLKFNLVINIILLCVALSASQRRLYENDVCKPGDTRWLCKKLSNCPTAQTAIKAGEWPETCTFDGLEPIVCCPPPPSQTNNPGPTKPKPLPAPTTNGKAKKMCEKYAKFVFRYEEPPILTPFGGTPSVEKIDECGVLTETLIVGGEDAKPKEFPHMAQIGYGNKPRIAWLCGGSLISEQFILSAAHCTEPNNRGPAKWALLGDLDVSKTNDDASPITVKIIQRINHPGYDSVRLYNDIALYKVEKPIDLNEYIRPICLDLGERSYKKAVASGWGHTMWGGFGSEKLQKVELNLVEDYKCNQSYSANIGKQLPNGIDSAYMICAGDEAGKDSCQGDSGGPLQIALKEPYCMYSIIGVTSFGKQCGSGIPGVYAHVSRYVSWIEKIVWP